MAAVRDRYDDIDSHSDPEHPFASLWFFMRIFCGPLFWPIIIANAIGWAWCAYQGSRGFHEGTSLVYRIFASTQ